MICETIILNVDIFRTIIWIPAVQVRDISYQLFLVRFNELGFAIELVKLGFPDRGVLVTQDIEIARSSSSSGKSYPNHENRRSSAVQIRE
jgi:hypothetical protein